MRHDPLGYLATELDSLKQQGLYRRLRILEGEQKPKTTVDHRQVVNLSSNNYLGLTTHPRLREAALEATRTLGVGSGSVRTIAGTMDIHMELERRLAAFKKTEAGVVFGRNGRGTIDHFGMHGRVDVQVGTLSKAIGALGGYVAGSRALIEFLYHRARPFLFSTSHPPAVAAACIAAVDVLEQEPQIIERLWENTRFFKAGLQALGFNTGLSESPITPVIAGEGSLAMKLSDRLFDEGVFAQGIAFPTVARDKARVRTIVTATHTRDELQFALDVFGKVGRELGIL